MKKNLKLSMAIIALTMLFCGTVFPSNFSTKHYKEKRVVTYTWFKDEYLTDPTGTVSSIDAEINRLRILFPYSLFSASFSMGLSEFEFGQYPNQTVAVIYSDR